MKVIEQLLINAGISPIAGVDEAGRGACAGPLVIASVILKDPFAPELSVVRDSKEISEKKREEIFDLIIDFNFCINYKFPFMNWYFKTLSNLSDKMVFPMDGFEWVKIGRSKLYSFAF